MKVIQISSFYKPSVGGVERQVEEIASHLQEKTTEVEVWTTDASHGAKPRLEIQNPKFEIRNNDQIPNSETQIIIDKDKSEIKVRRFPFWLSLGHFFRFSPVLLIKLFFTRFDVIHVHNSHDAHILGAILIKIIRRKKIVVTGHNPFIVSNEKRGEKLHSNVGFFDRVLKVFARYIDTYIALLNSEKKFVSEYLGIPSEKISVIPNGIRDLYYINNETNAQSRSNAEEQQKAHEHYDLIVGDICRMDFVKGIQNLKYAADNLTNVQFLFIGGDGGYLKTLKQLYKDNKNVYFNEAYISAEEAKEFFNYIDIFASPSVYEPFGITIVEAMTQGKLVLASDTAGPREIISSEYGDLIKSSDQQAWFEKIKYYLEHKEDILLKGKRAVKASEKYKWENIISEIIKVYDSLLSKSVNK
jgi:glycosyltransferase involved in cell wall biosynthesis